MTVLLVRFQLVLPVHQSLYIFQEPGTNEEIKQFAQGKYGAEFDLFAKIDVNGDSAEPLFKYLKMKQGGTFGE